MSLSPLLLFDSNDGDEVDLTSIWCLAPVNFTNLNRANKDIEARLLPVDQSVMRTSKPYFGAHGEEETPVLIPNTEVKLFSGDYTA